MRSTDNQSLKEQHDLREIVEQDLGPAAGRGRRALLWPCPFHHEQRGYSLVVWPDGYRCFGKCQTSGDVYDWLQQYRGLSFPEAVALLSDAPRTGIRVTVDRLAPAAEPPPGSWQAAARHVVEEAEETLWSVRGEQALAYLTERGLDAHTIQAAHLGVVPGGYRHWQTAAGLSVPCGITLPWYTGETLWAVKVRRAAGQPKYVQIGGGSGGGLYRGDALKGTRAVLFCEGEFDALIAHQEAEPLVAAVTLGSASAGLPDRWVFDLVRVPLILAAYDIDQAGTKGAARLQALSGRVRAIRVPHGKDITDFHLQGGDVYTWLARELRHAREQTFLGMTRTWSGQDDG